MINEPVFTNLAKKYHKSNAQVILRWHVQKENIVIRGSSNPDHITANFNIFDFALTQEEMAEIAKLDDKKRFYEPNDAKEESYASMTLDFNSQK